MGKALMADSAIKVVDSAFNGQIAIDMAKRHQPDIIVLDIEMPVMDGITALPELVKVSPKSKIIMASTLTMRNAEISLKAMSLGATDYLPKPSAKTGDEVQVFYRELIAKVKALSNVTSVATVAAEQKTQAVAAKAPVQLRSSDGMALHVGGVNALAIASSTGGPQALIEFFTGLKNNLVSIPIFITQHMPPAFTTILAGHIAKASGRPCHEAAEGMKVEAGNIYLAPGDYHMVPKKQDDGGVVITLNQNPPENFCRPAADPMLRSLSDIYGKKLVVLVLTGMGSDGVLGAKQVVENGGHVVAQDEASCVVYGMPKAVADAGICRAILPLSEIAGYLTQQIGGR